MTPIVDILVCQKNNKDIISKCLDSVMNQTYKKINCLVLDDNSDDGSIEYVKEKYPKVKCLELSGQGPSQNRKIGIEKSSGKYVVTLDSDSILKKDWVSKMVRLMEENQNIGLASGKILYEDRKDVINVAGGGLSRVGIVKHLGEGKNKETNNEIKKVIYLCSAAMILRRSILDTIGSFDGDYFYGHEDLDICWRANLAGFDVVYHPFAESYHEQNTTVKKMTSSKARFLASRNRTLTLLKNYSSWGLVKYSPLFFVHFAFLLVFRNKPFSTINGYWWNLVNWKYTRVKREKIQKFRKISDKTLFLLK